MGMTFQTFDLLKKNIEEFGKLGDVLTLGRLGNQIDKKSLNLVILNFFLIPRILKYSLAVFFL